MFVFDKESLLSLVIGIFVIVLLYWYSVRNHGYWKERGVRFIKPYPLLGTTGEIINKPSHEIELDRYKKFGRIYGHFEGTRPMLSVGDPELLKNILVKDFHIFPGNRFSGSTGNKIMDSMLSMVKGEDWKRIRTIVSPTFSTGKIKRMMSILTDCSETLMKNFKISTEKNEFIDAKKVFGAFTLDVIASAAFSTKLDSHQDPNNKFVKMARELLPAGLSWRILGFILAPKIMKLLGESFFSSTSLNFFSDVTYQIINERKRTGQTRNDFLQLLLDISKEFEEGKIEQLPEDADELTSNYNAKEYISPVSQSSVPKSLSADELVSQCVIFFLAGSETTSTTLALASYFIALYPHVQQKIYEEVTDVLTGTKGEITYEAVQKMKYLDNIISETLRLYPPAFRLERMAEADYKLGETEITVHKGMIITIPIAGLHRDPEFFPQPDLFNPDRFSADQKSKRKSFTYMPFGAGPRNCVAMRFALLEMKVCLAHLVETFEIRTCSQTKIPMEFCFGQMLLQPKEIILQLKLRTKPS